MVPLHLAMMRALWICRMHDIRLMASWSQMARACRSSGAILARKALKVVPMRPWVSTMAGVTTAGLYLVRFLSSLRWQQTLPSFSGSFHAERRGAAVEGRQRRHRRGPGGAEDGLGVAPNRSRNVDRSSKPPTPRRLGGRVCVCAVVRGLRVTGAIASAGHTTDPLRARCRGLVESSSLQ